MVDFFVIGAGRSGTTLLRSMLVGSPEIAVPDEAYFTVPLLRRAHQLSVADAWRVISTSPSLRSWDLDPASLQRAWHAHAPATVPDALSAVYRAYADARGARLVGDKTPYHCRHVELLAEAFPAAKFLLIERDGRQVVRSVQQTYFGSGSFTIDALKWNNDVTNVAAALPSLGDRVHRLSFEDLTTRPGPTMKEVAAFLGVAPDPAMLTPEARAEDLLRTMRRAEHLQGIARPVTAHPPVQLSPREEWLFHSVAAEADARVTGRDPALTQRQKVVRTTARATRRSRQLRRRVRAVTGRRIGRQQIDRYPPTPTVPDAAGRAGDVTALVLTHGAPAALERCLRSLEGQSRRPDRVLVLDNAGTPAATVPDDLEIPVVLLRSEANTGPAGGWADLIEQGAATPAGWLWLIDDDVAPDPDCLARLVEHGETHGALAVQPRIWEETSRVWRGYPAWLGTLLSRSILNQVGLPREELVWWAEDTEYLQIRLRDCGFPLTAAEKAVVRHSLVRRSAEPRWKRYYETRNSVWVRLRARQQYASPVHLRKLARAVASETVRAVKSPTPWRDTAAVAVGLVHGLAAELPAAPRFVAEGGAPRSAPGHRVVEVTRTDPASQGDPREPSGVEPTLPAGRH